jgi:hypothetical protein
MPARLSIQVLLFRYGNNNIPFSYIVNLKEKADIHSHERALTPARSKDMEAIITRAPATRQLESAAAEWLHASRRLARIVARAAWEALIATSRAALLVENGSRQRRRF